MTLSFTKMQALGNDFIVIDGVTQSIALSKTQIQHMADRRLGIGCDQVLLIEPPTVDDVDFMYRIFNADGSEVAQCGNGARCIARFIRDQGLNDKPVLNVATLEGKLSMRCLSDNHVSVDMGIPASASSNPCTLTLDDKTVDVHLVDIGNPHAILQVEAVEKAPVASLGSKLERHPQFPKGTNVEFMQIVDRTHITLRVYERGVGETMACGSGACAAVITGRLMDQLDEHVTVTLPGGHLSVTWKGPDHVVVLTGSADTVYSGSIQL